MGDRLNKMIIETLFGYKVKQHTFLTGELSGIGSGLGTTISQCYYLGDRVYLL